MSIVFNTFANTAFPNQLIIESCEAIGHIRHQDCVIHCNFIFIKEYIRPFEREFSCIHKPIKYCYVAVAPATELRVSMPHMKVKVAEEQEEVIREEKGPVVPESAPAPNVPVSEVLYHIAHPICNEIEGCIHMKAEEVAIDKILDNSNPLQSRDAVGGDKEDH